MRERVMYALPTVLWMTALVLIIGVVLGWLLRGWFNSWLTNEPLSLIYRWLRADKLRRQADNSWANELVSVAFQPPQKPGEFETMFFHMRCYAEGVTISFSTLEHEAEVADILLGEKSIIPPRRSATRWQSRICKKIRMIVLTLR